VTFVVAQFIAFFILLATVIGILIVVGSRRLAAKEEELRSVASARGWTFTSATEKGHRVHRWSGTTDGVSWQAESLKHASGGNKRERRRHIARWHGAWSPGINGPIVGMGVPKGKEVTGTSIAEGDGLFARLAQKAAGFAFDKAIDAYFGDAPGKEVDAGAMHRVDGVKIPGFIVMAADKDEGARILSQGFERALVDAGNDKASVLSDEDRPWILLRPNAVSLARMEQFRDVNELERFIRAGVALTRAFTFGRRSPS
jgi:hypothetical protein